MNLSSWFTLKVEKARFSKTSGKSIRCTHTQGFEKQASEAGCKLKRMEHPLIAPSSPYLLVHWKLLCKRWWHLLLVCSNELVYCDPSLLLYLQRTQPSPSLGWLHFTLQSTYNIKDLVNQEAYWFYMSLTMSNIM